MRTIARLLAAVLAIVLFAVAVLTVIEVVAAAFGADPILAPHDDWARNGRTTYWKDTDVRVFFVLAGIVGLIMLVVALSRRRPSHLAIAPVPGVPVVRVRRSSVEANLGRTAQTVDGIRSARVRVDRHRIRVNTTTNRKDRTGLADAVHHAIDGRLGQIGLTDTPPVSVATHTKDS